MLEELLGRIDWCKYCDDSAGRKRTNHLGTSENTLNISLILLNPLGNEWNTVANIVSVVSSLLIGRPMSFNKVHFIGAVFPSLCFNGVIKTN